ncbi:hypothetical protein ACX0G7_26895 [Flavitalea antarctica]
MRNERFDFFYLPEKFQQSHKSCEFLLYQIEDFVVKDDYRNLRVQSLQFTKEPYFLEGEHILDYLLRSGEHDKHSEINISNLLNALIADICQFMQIALLASLQKRLTVTLALIRKPFVYNLLVILRLYFTSDFLDRFNTEEKFDTAKLSEDDIKELLHISEGALFSKSIKAVDIYDIVFNPGSPDSIKNMSNKALHPSTTQNKNNLTEIQNLNFVFSTEKSIETQWDYLYRKLPLLLLYLNEVLEFIIFDHLKTDDKIYAERLIERANFFKHNNSC